MVDAEIVGDILGIHTKTLRDLARAVEDGLPKEALQRTARRAFEEKSAASKLALRVVPEATYKRRVRLTTEESERTERLARVIGAAEFVWGNREDAREWLSTPHPELENRTPLESAMTELGARRVEDILDGIFYGLPA